MGSQLIHLKIGKIEFKCPYCEHKYLDEYDVYCERINKNKCGYTWVNCNGCKKRFGVTVSMMGDFVGFEIMKKGYNRNAKRKQRKNEKI